MPFMAALLLALVVPMVYWVKTVAFAPAASGGNGLANVPRYILAALEKLQADVAAQERERKAK